MMVWLAPGVRAVAVSQSLPTPSTQELFLVVTREAVGAPGLALALAVAPMAPEPLVPEVSTPANVTTVIDEFTVWESVALTDTFESTEAAKARQTSAVPD